MMHVGTKEIKTKRLVLRKFRLDDAQNMFNNWANDERVTKFLSWKPHENIDLTRKILSEWIENYQKTDYYNWCIEMDNMPVGNICVVEINNEINGAELGYCLGYNWWGQGIMPEAMSAVVDFLLNNTEIKQVYAGHNIDNQKSGNVLKKCGFVLDDSLLNIERFKKIGYEIITYSYKLN